jgi:hypothetical protein
LRRPRSVYDGEEVTMTARTRPIRPAGLALAGLALALSSCAFDPGAGSVAPLPTNAPPATAPPTAALPAAAPASTRAPAARPTALPVATGAAAMANPAPTGSGPANDRLSPELDALVQAQRDGDAARLAGLIAAAGGDPAAATVRVVLEMAANPAAAGPAAAQPTAEVVTGKDGSPAAGSATVIEHPAPVTLRPDLAAALAATGSVVEAVYENLVQVLAPVAQLESLTGIPGVSRVRLPLPAGQ